MQQGDPSSSSQPGGLYGPSGSSGGARSWQSPPESGPMAGGPPRTGVGTQRTSGLAVASLVVGIVGVCLLFLFGFLSVLAGIVAGVLGILGMRQCDQVPGVTGKGMAVAGLVLGIVAFLGGVAYLIFFLFLFEEILREMGFVVPI